MSIIVLIQSVVGILINGFAAFLAPIVETSESGAVTPMTWISLAVSIVCLIINFVLAVMALQHKNIGLVYKISIFTLIFPPVFNIVVAGNSAGTFQPLTRIRSIRQSNKAIKGVKGDLLL